MSIVEASGQFVATCHVRPAADRSALSAKAAFWLILLLAAAWRLFGIKSTDVWRDEAISLIHTHASWWDLATRLPFVEDSPPLYFMLLKVWSSLFEAEWTMRLSSVLIGLGITAAIMKVARLVHPSSWAPAGLIAAVSHQPVHLSQELRGYALLLLLIVLSFWAAEHVRREPGKHSWHVLLGLLAALCAHCHIVGLFVFPMIWVYLLVRAWPPRHVLLLSPWMVGTWLAVCAPIFWFSIHWVFVHRTTGFWIPPLSRNTPSDLVNQFTGLSVVYLWVFSDGPPALMDLLSRAAPFIVNGSYVLLAVLALATPATRRASVALLAAGLLFVAVMVLTSLKGVPNMIPRTLAPAWIPTMLLLGVGAATSQEQIWLKVLRRAGLAVLVVVPALSWLWVVWCSHEPRRPAGIESLRWLSPRVRPADVIVITPSWVEDLVAYHLRGVIAGEQLFTIDAPAYSGRPPRHTLAHPRITVTPAELKPGLWLERINQAAAARQGQDYSVWLVCTIWQDVFNDPVLKQLRRVFKERFECVERYTPEEIDSLTINRLVPRGTPATATSPSEVGPPASGEHE